MLFDIPWQWYRSHVHSRNILREPNLHEEFASSASPLVNMHSSRSLEHGKHMRQTVSRRGLDGPLVLRIIVRGVGSSDVRRAADDGALPYIGRPVEPMRSRESSDGTDYVWIMASHEPFASLLGEATATATLGSRNLPLHDG